MPRSHNPGWTDERVAALKQMHAEGRSASEMAKVLGGITRNAAIGKCIRLGLGPIGGGRATPPSRAKVQSKYSRPPQTAPKPRQPAPKGVMVLNPVRGGDVTTAARAANMEVRSQPDEVVIPFKARAFAPLEGVEPVEFGSRGCKWPVGDMLACGAAADVSYCAAHAAVAYEPTPAKKKPNAAELARSLRRYI